MNRSDPNGHLFDDLIRSLFGEAFDAANRAERDLTASVLAAHSEGRNLTNSEVLGSLNSAAEAYGKGVAAASLELVDQNIPDTPEKAGWFALGIALGGVGGPELAETAAVGRTELVITEESTALAASASGTKASNGLGIFGEREVAVTPKGLDLVRTHLAQFGDFPQNAAMLKRLENAMSVDQKVTGADAIFYTHEAAEATMMSRGMSYEAAHAAALEKYGVSPYSVYHAEVISEFRNYFNPNWNAFWSLDK